MSFKENFDKEKNTLLKNKRPYESASFIILAILIGQQLFFLTRAIIQFMDKANTWFNTSNITIVANNQNFFTRIVGIDNSSWFYVLLAIAVLGLYYFLIYLFVWNYCRKRKLAKWTWTLYVVFGPTVFFLPAYIVYVIYVFRPYFFRFIKTVVSEYKSFDLSKPLEEDIEVEEVEQEHFNNEEY